MSPLPPRAHECDSREVDEPMEGSEEQNDQVPERRQTPGTGTSGRKRTAVRVADGTINTPRGAVRYPRHTERPLLRL